MRYNAPEIERKWQERWEADRLYEATERSDKPKWYALVMFPYPSGDLLHVGHWYNYGPADTHARFMRMRGYNVLFPFGFDAFGLPAENAAIKRGVHPRTWTMQNIENMRRQVRMMGATFDWSREIITCEPEYYKWTQWLFLQFYKHGLAYKAKAPANWCPSCQTVLANEQVIDGRCERCESIVYRRDLDQWFLRITAYAEELLNFEGLEWPEKIITMQRNWIGKSHGVEVTFRAERGDPIPVFTTRPDTIYGVTFLVLAPEHPLVPVLTSHDRRAEVEAYIDMTRRETEIERLSTEKEKTGVFIGHYAINPLNGERVPIWIADYVLLTYGTGAVMGVPAHDQRDFEFAQKFGLPVRVVIAPPGWQGEPLSQAYVDEGTMVNSGPFDGLPSAEAKERIADHIEELGLGRRTVNYRLRDWLISRQRYWGAPIPIIYCPHCGMVPVPEEQLPVLLPENVEFRPTGESPLKRCREFVETTCPQCGAPAERETDTMDTFVDSSWYFLRYVSPHESDRPWDPEKVRYWLPVDQYMGGAEHAVMHLLYSRFFVKALRDMGLLHFSEPFTRLFNQGLIISGGEKMSKSRGNVVIPDDYVRRLGADTFRAYLMFLGPWDQGGDWSDKGINGIYRFFNRVWNLVLNSGVDLRQSRPVVAETPAEQDLRRQTHRTLRIVTEHLEKFRFNTMLAHLMTYTSYLSDHQAEVKGTPAWDEAIRLLLLMLAPTAPHLAEELWAQLGGPYSIHQQSWPAYDPDLAREETVTVVVQINGRVRERLTVPADTPEATVIEMAKNSPRVQRFLQGVRIANTIYVPGRLLNIVTDHL
jgi:leucyl-tRNA synthetase